MNFSIIQKSQLEGGERLDPECYQPIYLKLDKDLNQYSPRKLSEYLEYLTDGAHKTPDYQDKGIPFLSSGLIFENYVDFDNAKFISNKEDYLLRHCKPKLNDILISKSGKIGMTTVFDKSVNCNLFEGVALLRTKNINPYFLSVFLNSKIGQIQIKRLVIGISQPHLHLEQIETIKIPTVNDKLQYDIEKIYLGSVSYLDKSNQYYKQAEDLLLEELGLKDFKIPEDLSYIVNYSDTEKIKRVDADYFQPKYEKLIAILKKQKTKRFSEVIEDAPARFVPRPDESYKYIELANINSSIGVTSGFSEILGKEAPSRARRLLKTGDVLVSSIQGALQKTALVNEEQDGSLASTGFFQFRSNEILPEVLLILAKSIVLQLQLERECAGTILSAVPQESLKRLIIPVMPKETQVKIADLVKKSHEARKKSKELLEEAKRKVEEMIERGGDQNVHKKRLIR